MQKLKEILVFTLQFVTFAPRKSLVNPEPLSRVGRGWSYKRTVSGKQARFIGISITI